MPMTGMRAMGINGSEKEPPSVRIKKVVNGYEVEKHGGSYTGNYMNNEYVYKTFDEVTESCKKFMEGK